MTGNINAFSPQTVSIVSYNHLGNNDGKNLSAPAQFRSKEISKSNVVDDMVQSNPILYKPNEKPDHCVSTRRASCFFSLIRVIFDASRAVYLLLQNLRNGGRNYGAAGRVDAPAILVETWKCRIIGLSETT